jgi:uncharacterized membrane protein
MKKIITLGFVLSAPFMALAATSTVDTILMKLIGWLNYIVPALITIAVIYFIWGVISFMTSSDEEAKKMGRTKIINGLIGLFVIVAFWGIIGLLQRTFDIRSGTETGVTPCVPTTANRMGLDC